jgi:hypothetical protein
MGLGATTKAGKSSLTNLGSADGAAKCSYSARMKLIGPFNFILGAP